MSNLHRLIFGVLWTLLFVFAGGADATAQEDRVSIESAAFETTTVAPGETATLLVTTKIQFLWHIYSVGEQAEAYPTKLTTDTSGVRFGQPTETEPVSGGEAGHELLYHENKVVFRVPVTFDETLSGRIRVNGQLDFMACNDMGCEPPKQLPFDATVTIATPVASGIAHEEPTVLKGPNGVFVASVSVTSGNQLSFAVELTPGHHIYAFTQPDGAVVTPTVVSLAEASGARLKGDLGEPTPQQKKGDEDWERYAYHEGAFVLTQEFEADSGARYIEGSITYQACDAKSCYDFTTLPFRIALPAAASAGGDSGSLTEGPVRQALENLSHDLNDVARRVKSIEATLNPKVELQPDAPAWKLQNASIELSQSKTRASGVVEAVLTFQSPESASIGSPKDIFVDFAASKRIGSIEAISATSSEDGLSHSITVEITASELAKSGTEEQLVSLAMPIDVGGFKFEMEVNAVPFELEFGLPNLWGWVLKAVIAALLALMTPCVFPMIPVTVSFFTKQAESQHRHPVVLPSIYVVGIIVSFVAIGAGFTAAFGSAGAQILATNGYLQGVFGLLFVAFSLSLFGVFTLTPPAFLMSRAGNVQGKGGIGGTLGMGLLFSLTSFTCTAPLVGYILVDAAESKEWELPIVGMLAFSAVLAVPFFFLALFPKLLKTMPKSGGWMNSVKATLGFLELAFAFKFIGAMDVYFGWGFFTREFILWIWVLIFLMNGLYLLGIIRFAHDMKVDRVGPVAGAFAILLIIFGVYIQKGAHGEPMPVLVEALMPPRLVEESDGGLLGWVNHTKNDLEAATERARNESAPLFMDFTGFI